MSIAVLFGGMSIGGEVGYKGGNLYPELIFSVRVFLVKSIQINPPSTKASYWWFEDI